MKHHRLVSRTPEKAQTTLQVKIDFKTGLVDAGNSMLGSFITQMVSLTESWTTTFREDKFLGTL